MDGASIKPRFKDFFLKTHKEWKSTNTLSSATQRNLSIFTASSQTDDQNDKETAVRPITHHRYNFNTSLRSVYCHINGEKNQAREFIGFLYNLYFFLSQGFFKE